MTENIRMSRRVALLVLSAGLTACGAEEGLLDALKRTTPVTLVLIDVSASIASADRDAVYKASLEALAADLGPGERLLAAHAGALDRSGFRAALDLTVPSSNVRLDREEALEIARAELRSQIDRLLDVGGTASTRLIEAIAAGSQVFGPFTGRPRGRLVLLSDGVEDSEILDLTTLPDDPATIAATLDELRTKSLLPDLTDVELFVAGAGGGERYGSVERWWRAFTVATGAELVAYGRLPYRART